MGFMGLSSWSESDGAADFRYTVTKQILPECIKELKDKANWCNTPGSINVALVIESGLLDSFKDYELEDYVESLFIPLIEKLEKLAESWKDEPGKQGGPLLNQAWGSEHRPAIKRMIKNVKKFCKCKKIKL